MCRHGFVLPILSLAAITLASGCTREAEMSPGQMPGEATISSEQDASTYAAAPYLGELGNTVLYGDIWERPGLSKRDRSMITIAVAQAQHGTGTMREHIGLALANGLTQEEIAEVITHATFYAGWPGAVIASTIAAEVFQARGLPPVEVGLPAPPVTESQFPDDVFGASLYLGELMNKVLYDDVWERPGLSKRDRSMVTVSVLQALYYDQARGHISRALNNGVTPDELSELIVHVVFYAGWPSGVKAHGFLRDILESRGLLMP